MRKNVQIDFTEGEGIEEESFKGSVVLKRLNFQERNSLNEESTEIKFIGRTPQVTVSQAKLKELGILKSLVSSDLMKTTYFEDKTTKERKPSTVKYELTIDNIRALPNALGELLFDEFSDLNELTDKKKES